MDNDAAARKIVHDVLGMKRVMLNLINTEIQRAVDFDVQYVKDCLGVALKMCDVTAQGAADCVAVKGTDLLLYLCETCPDLVGVCLRIMALMLQKSAALLVPSLMDKTNLACL